MDRPPPTSTKLTILNAKRNLEHSLGDDWQKYLSHLRKFFRNGTKAEFDREIRSFLTHKQIYYHNNFLLAVLQTSDVTEASQQAPPATPIPVKTEELPAQPPTVKRRRKNDEIVFQVHPINEFVRDAIDDPSKLSAVRYAAQELFLPDNSLVQGRFLTCCWENSLEYVDDQAVEIIVQAVQVMLKNILTHTIMRRKHFKVTADKKFFYDLGCEIKDPTVRNSMTRVKVDQEVPVVERKATDEANFVSSFEDFNVRRKKISLIDIYRTLKDKNVIPCHSVAMMTLERITTAINC